MKIASVTRMRQLAQTSAASGFRRSWTVSSGSADRIRKHKVGSLAREIVVDVGEDFARVNERAPCVTCEYYGTRSALCSIRW